MKYEIELKYLPAGIALEPGEPDQKEKTVAKAFLTPEMGHIYYKALEDCEDMFLKFFLEDSRNRISSIDHFLVLIDRDKKARILINELTFVYKAITKRKIDKGKGIYRKDIGGITDLRFMDIQIPKDNGIALYFSLKWRKGFYFNFTPLTSGTPLEDIERELGEIYEYFIFNEIYSITDEEWKKIFSIGWFPFISIIGGMFEELLSSLTSGISARSVEKKILCYFDDGKIKHIIDNWENATFLKHHIYFLKKGVERFRARDYISAISILWPRIEGILRFFYSRDEKKTSQGVLLDNMKDVVKNKLIAPRIFLPDKFKEYLENFYFKDFDIKSNQLKLSRHSLGHGVSDIKSYDKKNALIGILVIDQLFYYLSREEARVKT